MLEESVYIIYLYPVVMVPLDTVANTDKRSLSYFLQRYHFLCCNEAMVSNNDINNKI